MYLVQINEQTTTDRQTDRPTEHFGKEREREREGNEVRANILVAVVHMRVTC